MTDNCCSLIHCFSIIAICCTFTSDYQCVNHLQFYIHLFIYLFIMNKWQPIQAGKNDSSIGKDDRQAENTVAMKATSLNSYGLKTSQLTAKMQLCVLLVHFERCKFGIAYITLQHLYIDYQMLHVCLYDVPFCSVFKLPTIHIQ